VQTGCVEVLYERGKFGPQRGIQVDETSVYWQEVLSNDAGWTTGVQIFAAPKEGGGVVRALGEWTDYQAAALLVDDSNVYWLNQGSLTRSKKDGSERTTLTIPGFDTLDPGPILDAGDAILIGSHACHDFALVPKNGSTPRRWPVSSHQATGGTTGIEIDGTSFYCANGNYISVLDSLTGQVSELVSYAGSAGPLRKVGDSLYWIDSDNLDLRGPALVMLAPGSAPQAVGPAYGGTGHLLFDSTKEGLYWMTGIDWRDCDVVSFDVHSRATTFLARNQSRNGDTAQDADYVYWSANSAIMRVHK